MTKSKRSQLKTVRLGIETLHEFVVYIHANCHICKSEGFESQTQILISVNSHSITATLNVIKSDILKMDEVGLSESAWRHLGVNQGDLVTLSHSEPVASIHHIRSKIYNHELDAKQLDDIINDIVLGRYTNAHLASFITACAGRLNIDEIIHLTKSMIKSGVQLRWNYPEIMDKHSVGGIPGNRTTPIVVAIVASAGLIIPKTSSRAITSPAGTADTVETFTPVNLNTEQMRRVVDKEGGCMIWGGALGISPADDIIIQVERSLDIDPEEQMIASVLSKKVAAGATHVVLDIPIGPTAKIRSETAFLRLNEYFTIIGKAIGLNVITLKSDGTQPLGRGIGPALEAKDILAILRNEKNMAHDLKNKAILLSAMILEAGNKATEKNSVDMATEIIESGHALKKFHAICEAQGGFYEPKTARYTHPVLAPYAGIVAEINNRVLSEVAKLAGAPHDQVAGIEIFVKNGVNVEKDQPLYCIHADSEGELDYALSFAKSMPDIIRLFRI